MLSCRDLTFRYEGADRDALRGVSLAVDPKHVVGIAGCSGSGKSTLLLCLAGQLTPHAGTLAADGQVFGNTDPSRWMYRQRVALAVQLPERQLFARSVGEDVAFGPRNLGLEEGEVDERVAWALGAVGLDAATFCDRSPFALSGGEARRVALAGVLALRPRYLLLDEPTAGLDPREGRRLLALLASLASQGMGVVLVSHDVDALAGTCTDVVLLREGEVACGGPVREVLGDARRVRACGMVPSAEVELAERLRQRGVPVPSGALSVDEIAQALRRWRGEAKGS